MLSILINAYACSPNMGSEPGMAWNWCLNLAKYCELYIITEGEFKNEIESVLETLPQSSNMHFYYNPVSEKTRRMCWNQGDWRFYKHYRKWQYSTLLMALDITKNHHIDIIHQLNMIGFREPGYLWKIKKRPFVWGPVDAKEKFPSKFLKGAPVKTKLFMSLKNFITYIQLKYSVRVKKASTKAACVISASSESQISFLKFYKIKSILINETGCYPNELKKINYDKGTNKAFNILWIGKLDFRKQLDIAIQTISKLKTSNIFLHIIGNGNQEKSRKLSEQLNVSEQCIWHGRIPHDTVQEIMQKSDLLFFTSVAEGTPHVILEAISNRLPVVCFNCCGQGDVINDKIGVKIPLSTPAQSVIDFAEQINYLYKNKDILQHMSNNCEQVQKEISWDKKAKQLVEIYNRIINA